MSTSIDQRVVQMRFDNRDFEKNANSTISVLEKLKSKLTLKESGKALEEFQNTANKMNFDSLSKSSESLGAILETKVIAKFAVVENMINRLTNAGVNMAKSLSVDQISSGFNKYEQKLGNTQSIMNATGKSLDEVNAQLNKLMWYTDETSYSFSDMANTVGKFTAFDIPLDKAVTAIIGIGNAAGLAGASVQDATHAMQGFAKGIGTYMDRQDWSWISTAHMDTAEFKKQLMETAAAMGVLSKVSDGVYKTSKGTIANIQSFETTLSEKWLSGDILTSTLNKYGEYSEAVYELYQNGVATSDAMDALSGKFDAVGEKGMRAAQESKTFADALNAVKDAISSGWMQTFETLFGNFEEAKEVWASLYDELYDIFAASGETRNEILSEWKELGGRDELFETIALSWEKIKSAMEGVKGVVEEVFPPITAQRLLEIVRGFKSFVSQLKLSQDATYTLGVLLRALLFPLKLLAAGIKIAVTWLQVFIVVAVKVADLILSTMANTELAERVFKRVFGEQNGARIFNALATIIQNVSNGISDLKNNIYEFFSSISSDVSFTSFITWLRESLISLKDTAIDVFASILEAIATGDWSKLLDKISSKIKGLGKTISEFGKKLSNVLGKYIKLEDIHFPEIHIPEGFTNLLTNIKDFLDEINPFKEALEGTTTIGEKMGAVFSVVANAIAEFTKKVSPAKILVFGFGVALINLVYQFSMLVNAATAVTNSFSGIGKSAKSVLDAISKRINPTKTKIQNFGDAALKVAAAITIISIAMMKLTEVPSDRLSDVNIELIKIIGTITAAAAVMGIIDIVAGKLKVATNGLEKFSEIIFAFSLSIVAFAASLRLLSGQEIDIGPILAIISMLGAMTLAIGYLATKKNEFDKGEFLIISMAGSIYVMALALNKIDTRHLGSKIAALITVMGSLTILVGVAAMAGEHTSKAIRSLSSLSRALLLMTGVLWVLGTVGRNNIDTIAVGTVIALTELFTIMVPMLILTRLLGKYMSSSMSSLKSMATGIALLVIPVYAFGKMNTSVIEKGTAVVRSLVTLLGVFSIVQSAIDGIFGNEKGSAFASNMIQFATAVSLLAIPIALLGYIDTDALIKGTTSVGIIMVLLGAISAIQSKAEKAKSALVPAIAAIGLFSAAVAVLSFIEWPDLIKGLAAMVIATGGFILLFKQLNNLDVKGAKTILITVIAAIGLLAAALILMRNIYDPYEAIAKLGGIALVIAALGKAVNEVGSVEIDNDVTKKLSLLGGFVLSAIAIALTLELHNSNTWDIILANAASMALVIVAIGKAMAMVSEAEEESEDSGSVLDELKLMGAFVLAAGVAVTALGHIGSKDIVTAIGNAAALSLVLVALGKTMSIVSGGGDDEDEGGSDSWQDVLKNMATMGSFIAAASVAIIALGHLGGDPLKAIGNAVALSGVILAIGGAVRIMSGVNFEMGYQQILSMSAFVLAAAGAIWIIGQTKTEGILEKAVAMTLIIGVVVGVAELFGHFPIDDQAVGKGLVAALKVIGVISAVIAAITILAALIGEALNAWDQNGTIEAAIDRTAGIVEQIGGLIAGFFGGMVKGFNDAATENMIIVGARIASFVNSIGTAFSNIGNIDLETFARIMDFFDEVQSVVDMANSISLAQISGLGTIADTMIEISPKFMEFSNKVEGFATTDAVAAINGMKTVSEAMSTLDGINPPDLTGFGESLNNFAPYLNSFLQEISEGNISPASVMAATNAAKAAASFAVELGDNAIANGLDLYVSDTPGDGILARFGAELAAFGPKFSVFAACMKNVTEEDIASGIAAATTVSEFAKCLPREGGLLQDVVGENKSLSKFACELAAFAPYFVNYANTMSGVTDWASVENSSKAALLVAKFANSLPTTGGVLAEWVFGEKKNLSAFGEELSKFGAHLFAFSNVAKQIDTDSIENATTSAKKIISIYSELPTTGGWLDWLFGGDMDLTEFGKQISDLGKAMEKYNGHVSDLNYDAINKSFSATTLIINLSQNLGNFKKENVSKFKKDISEFAETGIDDFLQKFEDAGTDFTNAGKIVISDIVEGMNISRQDLNSAIDEIMVSLVATLEVHAESQTLHDAAKLISTNIASTISDKETFSTCASDIVNYISNGLKENEGTPKNTIREILKGMYQEANNYNDSNGNYSVLYSVYGGKIIDGIINGLTKKEKNLYKKANSIGKNILDGIVKGMKNAEKKALNSASSIINNILNSMKKTAKIKSPSKRSEKEVGDNLIGGIVRSFTKDKSAERAAKTKTGSIIDSMFGSDAINSVKNKAKIFADTIKDAFNDLSINITTNFGGGFAKVDKPLQEIVLGKPDKYLTDKIFTKPDKPLQDKVLASEQFILSRYAGILHTQIDSKTKRNQFDVIHDTLVRATKQIAKQSAKASEAAEAFEKEFNSGYGRLTELNSLYNESGRLTTAKIAALENAINEQRKVVDIATSNYRTAVEAFGDESSNADAALEALNNEQAKLNDLSGRLSEAQEHLQTALGPDLIPYAKMFIENVSDTVAKAEAEVLNAQLKLKETGEEIDTSTIEFFKTLQEDIADTIINDPVIINAIRDRVGDIIDIFSGIADEIDLDQSLVDKEYSLWEKTLGYDATDEEKLNKKRELLESQLASNAEAVKVAESQMTMMAGMFGTESKEYKDAKADLYDAQIEFAETGRDYAEVLWELNHVKNEAANEDLEAAEKMKEAAEIEEEALEDTRTAREKALDEFEEWRKDGSLKEWHDFGATDEELMDALLKKYEDEEREAAKRKQKQQETTKKETEKTKEEAKDEFNASGAEILNILNSYLGNVDAKEIDNKISTGMNDLVLTWVDEFKDAIDQHVGDFESVSRAGTSDISDAISKGIQIDGESGVYLDSEYYDAINATKMVRYRNRKTGQIVTAERNRYNYENIPQSLVAAGEDPSNYILLDTDIDWDEVLEEWKSIQVQKFMNTRGLTSLFTEDKGFDKKMEYFRRSFIETYGFNPAEMLYEDAMKNDVLKDKNGLPDGMVVVQDPNGQWRIVWLDQLDQYLNNGYKYFESKAYNMRILNGVVDSLKFGDLGYRQDLDPTTFKINPLDLDDQSALGPVGDEIEKEAYDASSKGMTSGLTKGISDAVSNFNLGSSAAGIDYSSLINEVQGVVSEGVDGALGGYVPDTNSWAYLLNQFITSKEGNLNDFVNWITGGSFNVQNAITGGIDSIINSGLVQDAQNAWNGLGEAYDSLGNIVDAVTGVAGDIHIVNKTSQEMIKDFRTGEVTKNYLEAGMVNGEEYGNGILLGFQNKAKLIQESITGALRSNSVYSLLGYSGLGKSGNSISPVAMAGLLGSSKPSVNYTTSLANKASELMADRLETALKYLKPTDTETKAPNYQFVQNNYSPKALSRYDIYRDTKNQLARLRGVTSK